MGFFLQLHNNNKYISKAQNPSIRDLHEAQRMVNVQLKTSTPPPPPPKKKKEEKKKEEEKKKKKLIKLF